MPASLVDAEEELVLVLAGVVQIWIDVLSLGLVVLSVGIDIRMASYKGLP